MFLDVCPDHTILQYFSCDLTRARYRVVNVETSWNPLQVPYTKDLVGLIRYFINMSAPRQIADCISLHFFTLNSLRFCWLHAYKLSRSGYSKKKIIRQCAFDKKKKKRGLKFNPGLALTGVRTTGPWLKYGMINWAVYNPGCFAAVSI